MDRYHGKHREDEVGSLRYSDDDCLTSEAIGERIRAHIHDNKNVQECSE